jgi:hypothetical protein
MSHDKYLRYYLDLCPDDLKAQFLDSLYVGPCGYLLFDNPSDRERFLKNEFKSAVNILLGRDQHDVRTGDLAPEPLARTCGAFQLAMFLEITHDIRLANQFWCPTGYNFEAPRMGRTIDSAWEKLGLPLNSLRMFEERMARNTGDNLKYAAQATLLFSQLLLEQTQPLPDPCLITVSTTNYHSWRLWTQNRVLPSQLSLLGELDKLKRTSLSGSTEQANHAVAVLLVPDRHQLSENLGNRYCRQIVEIGQMTYGLDRLIGFIRSKDAVQVDGLSYVELGDSLNKAASLFDFMLSKLHGCASRDFLGNHTAFEDSPRAMQIFKEIHELPATPKDQDSSNEGKTVTADLAKSLCETLKGKESKVRRSGLLNLANEFSEDLEKMDSLSKRVRAIREAADTDEHLMQPSNDWEAPVTAPLV